LQWNRKVIQIFGYFLGGIVFVVIDADDKHCVCTASGEDEVMAVGGHVKQSGTGLVNILYQLRSRCMVPRENNCFPKAQLPDRVKG